MARGSGKGKGAMGKGQGARLLTSYVSQSYVKRRLSYWDKTETTSTIVWSRLGCQEEILNSQHLRLKLSGRGKPEVSVPRPAYR